MYSWRAHCDVWVGFVFPLLPSQSIWIVAQAKFFCNIEHFWFQRLVFLQTCCAAFLEALTFFVFLRSSTPWSSLVLSQYYSRFVLNMKSYLHLPARCLLRQKRSQQSVTSTTYKWFVRNGFRFMEAPFNSFGFGRSRRQRLFELWAGSSRWLHLKQRHLCITRLWEL